VRQAEIKVEEGEQRREVCKESAQKRESCSNKLSVCGVQTIAVHKQHTRERPARQERRCENFQWCTENKKVNQRDGNVH
jgi:hypothetical protein